MPYTLPAVVPEELDHLLESMCREAALGPSQIHDLQTRVRPHLDYVARDRRVNPREVKRFINAYTLQTLVRPDLKADAVLALQTLSFPFEWQVFYNTILTNEASFRKVLKKYRQSEENEQAIFSDLSTDLGKLPSSLASFLRSPLAEPLIQQDSLDPYISSLKSTSLKPTPTAGMDWPPMRLPGKDRRASKGSSCPSCGAELIENVDGTYYCRECGKIFCN